MLGRLLPLVARHAWHHRGRTALLVGCVAVALALPVVGRLLTARFESALTARAATAPLVVGAKGSRYDLVFGALYFRPGDIGPAPHRAYRNLLGDPLVEPMAGAIPIHARFTARGAPVVATGVEYFQRRGLGVTRGRMVARLGEAVVGAKAAQRLGLGVGDALFSDQRDAYDITSPPSVRLEVVGVLGPTGSPDDAAVFVALGTAWVLEGIAHGHEDARAVERSELVIGLTEEHVALSGAITTYQEITDENAASFHVHGSRDALPLTAVLVYPRDEKARTILASRTNASDALQAVVPLRVVEELMAFVVRLRLVFDALALVLAASTAALIVLIGSLSYKLRAGEVMTLREIGCARGTVALLFALELVLVLALAAAIAAALAAATLAAVAASTVYL